MTASDWRVTGRRVVLGIGTSGLAQAVSALQSFVLVPLFLTAWGTHEYGHWVALTAVASYFNLFDMGGQTYYANVLADVYARGDEEQFADRLSEGVSLFALIGVAAFSIVLIVLWIAHRSTIPFLVRPLSSSEAAVIAMLVCQALLLAVPGGVYVTVYRATGRFAHGMMIGTVSKLCGIGISTGLLLSGAGPKMYVGSTLCLASVTTAWIVVDTHRHIPACRQLHLTWAAARRGYRQLGQALEFWVIGVAQAINQQGVSLILAVVAGPTAVAVYTTHRIIANIPGFIGSVFQGPILPELTYLWALRRRGDLERTSQVLVMSLVMLTGLAAITLWLTAPMFFELWTRHRMPLNRTLLLVLLCQATLAAGWSTSVWALLATNHHRYVALWSSVNAAITVALAIAFGGTWGPFGVAVASLIGDLACGALVFPMLAARFVRTSATSQYLRIVLPLAAVGALGGVVTVIDARLGMAWASGLFIAILVVAGWQSFKSIDRLARMSMPIAFAEKRSLT